MDLDAKWKQTVEYGLTNKAWDDYDQLVQTEVNDYRQRFSGRPGPLMLDWLYVKAILWVETGALSPKWKTRPMQIGNPLDPAYTVLKQEKEGASLIMSEKLKHDLKVMRIDEPTLNVRAGIAYLVTRLANFDVRSVDDPADPTTHTYQVKRGDTFSTIAKSQKTTVPVLTAMNPKQVKSMHPRDVLSYHQAAMQLVLTGWKPINTAQIARLYNSGDAHYAEKLDYVLQLFKKLQR